MPYLYEIYAPCILFVWISWYSFLIPPEMVPGRMTLLVTLLLMLVNTFFSVIQLTPQTSKITDMNVFITVCIIMVVLK